MDLVRPLIAVQSLHRFESYNLDGSFLYTTFYYVSPQDEVWSGKSSKRIREITLDEYQQQIQRIPDDQIFPEVPHDSNLTLAPTKVDDATTYVKRPGLWRWNPDFVSSIPLEVLQETLIMQQLSQKPHPNIVGYHGCWVRRGRITGLVLERQNHTLDQYRRLLPLEFDRLDKARFIARIDGVLKHLHSLGLAHNDISPYNVMVKDSEPVVIDFGGCQPFGKPLISCGTPGFVKEPVRTSQKEHDVFALNKLEEWMNEVREGA